MGDNKQAEIEARAKIGAQLAAELIATFNADQLKRILVALDKADEAFWGTFAAQFPEIMTGDLPADAQIAFDAACKEAVVTWIRTNTRTAIVLPGAKPGASKKVDRAADVYEHCSRIGDWVPAFEYPGFIAWRDPLYGEVFATPGWDSPNKISVQMNYTGERAGDAVAGTCLELEWDGTAADYMRKVGAYLQDDVMRLAAMDAIENEPCVTDYAHDVVDDLFKDAKYALAEYVSTRGGHVADYVWLEEHMGDKMKGCCHPGAYHGGLAMAVAFLKDRYPGIVANIGYLHDADVPSDTWWRAIPLVHFATFRTTIDGKMIVESVEVPGHSEFADKVYDATLPSPLTPQAAWDKLKDLP